MKGGYALIKAIESIHGKDPVTIFGVPGSMMATMLDAVTDCNINFVETRSEQTAGGGAMGWAQADMGNTVGFYACTRGPGTLHGLEALRSGTDHSVPMVQIATVAKSSIVNNRKAWQNFDYVKAGDIFAKGTVLAMPYHSKEEGSLNIIEALIKATKLARSGQQGGVLLALPQDVLAEEIPDDIRMPTATDVEPDYIKPNQEHINEFHEMLNEAKNPVFIVGNGGTQYMDKISALAQQAGVSTYGTFMHLEQRPTNPNYAGSAAYINRPEVEKQILEEADLVVWVGSRGHEPDLLGFNERFNIENLAAGEVKVVHITPEFYRGHEFSDYNLNVFGDMDETLDTLVKKQYEISSEQQKWVENNHASYVAHINENVPFAGNLNLQELMRQIGPKMGDNTVIMFGTGAYFTWGKDVVIDPDKGQEFVGPTESMGKHMGRMLGYLQRSGKKGVLVLGDGGMGMVGQEGEIIKAVEMGLDLTVVVVDNGVHGAILNNQAKAYAKGDINNPAGVGTIHETQLDFARVMQVFGAKTTETIKNTENIAAKLDRLFGDGAKVKGLHVIVDPTNVARGRVIDTGQLDTELLTTAQNRSNLIGH